MSKYPQEWEFAPINTLVASLDSGVSVNSEDRHKNDGEIGVLKVSSVSYGVFKPDEHKTIITSETDRVKVTPKRNSVIISRANTIELVGASAYIDRDYPDLYLSDKLWQTVPKKEYSVRWLGYVLASPSTRTIISQRASGTSAGMKNISKEDFLSINIPIPPLEEQRKIAAILGTWDRAIGLVEALIAALQARKKGLMQLLLTGQARFLEFDGEWEEVELGEIFEISAGGDHDVENSSEFQDDVYRYPIYSNALTDNGLYGYTSYSRHKANSITVTARGTLGSANYRDHDFTAIGRLLILKPRVALNSIFFANYINDRIKIIYESTGVPQLTAPQISRYKALFPSVSEQLSIAELLHLADVELQLYEQMKKRFQQQKKGLMQQLLTGQVRVKVD